MSDLISRQATLKHIEKIRQEAQMLDDTHKADILMRGMYLCERVVKNQPPAQPEQKKGKWIVRFVFEDCRYVKCNQCKVTQVLHNSNSLPNFCSNCGAKMDEVQDE